MKYVQAVKPEKHNGGVFFEHEIHLMLEGYPARSGSRTLTASIEEFITGTIGTKHQDFRVSVIVKYLYPDGAPYRTPVPYADIRVRFQDKAKALLFKLSYIV